MAKTISDENIRLNLIINGNEGQKKLHDLEKSTRSLTKANKDLKAERAKLVAAGKKESQEYKNLTSEISKNNKVIKQNKEQTEALQKQLGITSLTMDQLKKRAALLRMKLLHVVPGGEKEKEYRAELSKIDQRLGQLSFKAQKTKLSLSSLANGFNKYAAMGASFIAVTTGIVLSLQKMIDYNGKLSDAQSDVQKTTGMTKKEVDELTKSFGALQTRTSRIDLLKIAEEGGRIGIAKDEISGFVKVMNQANVALGDSFTGGVSEVASKLGKLKLLFKETKDVGVDKAYNAIGSAINDLGANGVATESNIAEFATRIGSLPEALKPTIQEALALGAAFEESGIEAEVSSRNYSIFLGQAAKNAEDFAKVMGITTGEVEDLINTNPTEFFLQFSKILNDTSEGGVDMAKTLSDLGLSADGVKKIIGAAGNNVDRFRKLMDLSNTSMAKGTSLTNEYNLKNNNLAAVLERLKKKTLGWFSSDGFISFLTGAASAMARLVGVSTKQSKALKKQKSETNILISSITGLNKESDARKRLLTELQQKYPSFLENLDKEKVTNDQLLTRLEKVNQEYRERIKLAAYGEEISEQEKKLQELEREEINLIKSIEDARRTHNISSNDYSTEGVVEAFQKTAETGAIAKGLALGIQKSYDKILETRKEQEAVEKNINYYKAQAAGINVSTGFTETKNVTKTTEVTTTTTSGDGEENTPLTAQKRAELELTQFIKDQQDKRKNLKKEVLEQELARIDQEYAEKIQKAGENDELIKQLEAEKELEKTDLKLQRTAEAHQRIKELEDSLALDKTATDEEKEIIQAEQDLQIHLAELDRIALNAAEKKQLVTLLELKEKEALSKINAKYRKKEITDRKNLHKSILNESLNLVGQETRLGQALLAIKGVFAAKETLIQLGLLKNQVAIGTAKSTAAVAEGTAQTAKVGFPQNIPLLIGFAAQVAGIISAVKNAASPKGVSMDGFEEGLYDNVMPVIRQQDGKLFNAAYGGTIQSGIVDKPTVFNTAQGKILTGENGAEVIIDNGAFRQMDPGIKNSMLREIARVKGFEVGLYNQSSSAPAAVATETSEETENDNSNALLITLLTKNIEVLEKMNNEGVLAVFKDDLKSAKKLQEKIAEYNALRTKNKK